MKIIFLIFLLQIYTCIPPRQKSYISLSNWLPSPEDCESCSSLSFSENAPSTLQRKVNYCIEALQHHSLNNIVNFLNSDAVKISLDRNSHLQDFINDLFTILYQKINKETLIDLNVVNGFINNDFIKSYLVFVFNAKELFVKLGKLNRELKEYAKNYEFDGIAEYPASGFKPSNDIIEYYDLLCLTFKEVLLGLFKEAENKIDDAINKLISVNNRLLYWKNLSNDSKSKAFTMALNVVLNKE